MRVRLKLAGMAALALCSMQVRGQSMVAMPDETSRALGQCMVLKTNGEDRLLVARWLAGAMGSGDATKGMITVDPARKAATDKEMAALYTKLLSQDCATEAAPLFKTRNVKGIEAAGGMLGEIAMRELMNDQKVSAAIAAYVQYVDLAAFEALAK